MRTHTRTLQGLVLVLALAIAACAPGSSAPADGNGNGNDGNGDDGNGDDGGDVSLRVTVWTGADEHLALFDDIADAFIDQHDQVTDVTFDVLSFDDYNEALTVQLAGGNPPDLGWVFERNAPEFIESGVLADIGADLAGDADYGVDDLSDAAMGLWQDGDAVYAYPFSTSPFNVFYNADAYAEAGLDNPSELLERGEWTWDALIDSAAEIVDEGVMRHGFVVRDFDYALWDNLATFWRGWDAEPWSEDGTSCQFDTPEMIDAFTAFHAAVFERGAHPGPGQGADFFAGESALTITQISRASLLEDDGFEWGVVPLPEGPAGANQVVGQAGLGVFQQGGNVAAASDFLRFMTNEENSRELAQFFPPPRESLLTADILGETNPRLSVEQLESVVVEGIATGDAIPSHVNFAQIRDAVRAELDAVWEADADVAAVMADVCSAIDPMLAE